MTELIATAERRPPPHWRAWGTAALGYLAMAALATWPVAARFGAAIPGELTDPLEHLWIMRWLRSCLLEGRNPLFCPGIQAPVGVPLGYFPTLHLQTALYVLLRLVTENDAAIFDAIWFLGLVATGLAAFGLARWAVPGSGSGVPWVAGLGMMLTGPMLMHAHGHLETMQMGVVPPFLVAWIRFVDRPGWRRLAPAAGFYLVVAAAAPYFAVLATFPAAWSVVAALAAEKGVRNRFARLGALALWLIGFVAAVLPGVAAVYAAQVWAGLAGYPMTRSKRLFEHFGAPVWSGVVPSPRHALGRAFFPDWYELTGYAGRMTECSSYLGVVALGLLGYAALARVRFPRRGYWWSALGLMVVLSWGTRQDLFGIKATLPAGWIYDVFPPFHLIRVPARFNLFAAAVAVVPIAAALHDLARRVARPAARGTLLAGLAVLTLADLAMVPFPTAEILDPPPFYADLMQARPDAKILEAPLFDSTRGQVFSSLWGYWQQRTGLATSGGYPGLTNTRFDAEVARPSVFSAARLDNGTHSGDCERDGVLDIRDRAWLELTTLGFDYAVLHHGAASDFDRGGRMGFLRDRLAAGIVHATAEATAIARDRFGPPRSLVWLTDQGWRPVPTPHDQPDRGSAALREARVALYQPQAGSIVLELGEVAAFARPRVVRVIEGEVEPARFELAPGEPRTVRTAPIVVGTGLHLWTLRSDGADRPARSADRLDDAGTPYSFRLKSVRLRAEKPE